MACGMNVDAHRQHSGSCSSLELVEAKSAEALLAAVVTALLQRASCSRSSIPSCTPAELQHNATICSNQQQRVARSVA
jgi:hypothetical protein